jgi:hypothetical protein
LAIPVKEVSDAIIGRLATGVEGLSARTAVTFAGSPGQLAESGYNVPFAGVALSGIDYEELTSDGSLARERLSFQLTLVTEDFRGPGFSIENTYGLVDRVRQALLGWTPPSGNLAPLRILSVARESESEHLGLSVFRIAVETWQIREVTVG